MNDDPNTPPPLLHLDIDGVLLRRRQPGLFDAFELAPDCLEFLEWATTQFRCRWLSTRCRAGWPDGSRRAFQHAGARLEELRWTAVFKLIEPARWSAHKTEALDANSNFWWVDDNPTEYDRGWLRDHGRQDRLIEISSDRYPGALNSAKSRLTMALSVVWGCRDTGQPSAQHCEILLIRGSRRERTCPLPRGILAADAGELS
jgi:hypothetical protein